MEYIVTYDKDGSRNMVHMTNCPDSLPHIAKMIELCVGGTVKVVSISEVTITVPVIS